MTCLPDEAFCGLKLAEARPEHLHRLLDFDPATGVFTWHERTPAMFNIGGSGSVAYCDYWNGLYAGKRAFSRVDSHGYYAGRLLNKLVRAHRVAWFMAHGHWAPVLDHINRDRADNRIENLRSVTKAENNRNRDHYANADDSNVGLVFNTEPATWSAFVAPGGAYLHLGTFATRAEAKAARNAAVVCLRRLSACDHPNGDRFAGPLPFNHDATDSREAQA